MFNIKLILAAAAGIGAVVYAVSKICKAKDYEDECDCVGCGDDDICKGCEYRSFCENCCLDDNNFTADDNSGNDDSESSENGDDNTGHHSCWKNKADAILLMSEKFAKELGAYAKSNSEGGENS